MKFWTILALLIAVLSVYLRIGQTEETETPDDVDEKALQDDGSDAEE